MTIRIVIYAMLFSLAIISFGCKTENHIEKYKVNLDSLKTLPDGFYAYRRGRIYFEDVHLEKYRIWYNLDDKNDVGSVFKVEDFKDKNVMDEETINKYGIDTFRSKIVMQKFIGLSRKFKFGLISIDKSSKISFSYQDGLSEQFVMPLSDSIKNLYQSKTDFRLLNNGWFEYVDR